MNNPDCPQPIPDLPASRTGQLVVDNDLLFVVEREGIADKIGADKSSPSRNEDFHGPTSWGAGRNAGLRNILFAPVCATRLLA